MAKAKEKEQKKRTSSFRGKVATEVTSRQESGGFGYLKLPKEVKLFTPKPGETYFMDILPYEVTDEKHPDRNDEVGRALKGDLWYKRPIKVHVNVGPDQETVVCPSTIGKPCPVCTHAKTLSKRGVDKDELREYWAKLRNLYALIPLDSEDYKETIHVMNISQYCFQDTLDEELKDDEDLEVFPDLEEGYTLEVRFKKKTMPGASKPFAMASKINFEDRNEAYDEAILDEVPNLDDCFKVLSFEELDELFYTMVDRLDVDHDEDEDRPSRRSKRSKKEDDDDDDKDEKPARRSRDKAPAKVEDDDDDDKDEKPVRKRHTAAPEKEEAPTRSRREKVEEKEEKVETPPTRSRTRTAPAAEKEVKKEEPAEELDADALKDMDLDELVSLAETDKRLRKLDVSDYNDDEVDELREVIADTLGIELKKKSSRKR